MTKALAANGIDDYARSWTRIEARHAIAGELHDLRLSPGAIVLVATGVNVDTLGVPVQYAMSSFPADRVHLAVGELPS